MDWNYEGGRWKQLSTGKPNEKGKCMKKTLDVEDDPSKPMYMQRSKKKIMEHN